MRVLRRSLRRGARAQEPSAALRISKRLLWRAPVAAGLLATLALALLNGDLRVSPAEWSARLLIAAVQVGLLVAHSSTRQVCCVRQGLALRSPVAHSTREVGLALVFLIGLMSLVGIRAASLVGQGTTLEPRTGLSGLRAADCRRDAAQCADSPAACALCVRGAIGRRCRLAWLTCVHARRGRVSGLGRESGDCADAPPHGYVLGRRLAERAAGGGRVWNRAGRIGGMDRRAEQWTMGHRHRRRRGCPLSGSG
jgi:hypothetical protein